MKPVCLLLAIIAMLVGISQGQAQSDELPRRELGIHFTAIDLNEVFEIPGGIGGRFTYNITKHLAIDSELNHFPRRDQTQRLVVTGFEDQARGHAAGGLAFERSADSLPFGETQGHIGLKAGVRTKTLGLFAKVRPGFMHFRRRHITEDFNNQSRIRFALDIGGVFEYYPLRQLAVRIDMGDTIIPMGGRTIRTPTEIFHVDTGLHNLQAGIGLSLRF